MAFNKNKWNYVGFSFILLIVFFSFVLIFVEPHNLYNLKEESVALNDSNKGNVLLNISDTSSVKNYILGSQQEIIQNANYCKQNNEITESQHLEISEIVKKSIWDYSEYERNTKDSNSLYESLKWIRYADSLAIYYPLQNCINESTNTIEKYNSFFFFLKKEDIDTLSNLKKEQECFENYIWWYYEIETDKGINSTVTHYAFYSDYIKAKSDCAKFKKRITDDYNYQYELFKYKIVISILIICLVFIAGNLFKISTLKSMKERVFLNIQQTEDVKKETIKQILKLSSLTTTFAALAGIITKILNLNPILLFIAIICTIFLLVSNLLGVISLNNNKPQLLRKISYQLFIFGSIFFIMIIVGIVFFISIDSITDAVKETIVFYSNSTIS